MNRTLATCVLAALAGTAQAHDTWFQPLSVQPGSAVLALGTGTRFPQYQFAIGTEHLQASGCQGNDGRPMRLTPVRDMPTHLLLQAAGRNGGSEGMSCWAQLLPSEIELAPETVQVYLDEVHASPAVRQAWEALRQRGLLWKERYVKHARIVAGNGPAVLQPSGMSLDLLPEGELHAGGTASFQLLRDGQPLPGLPLELVGAQGQSAGWAHTDDQGRVRFTLPAPGRWLLRGTELRLSGDTWDSRFVTLAFEVR